MYLRVRMRESSIFHKDSEMKMRCLEFSRCSQVYLGHHGRNQLRYFYSLVWTYVSFMRCTQRASCWLLVYGWSKALTWFADFQGASSDTQSHMRTGKCSVCTCGITFLPACLPSFHLPSFIPFSFLPSTFLPSFLLGERSYNFFYNRFSKKWVSLNWFVKISNGFDVYTDAFCYSSIHLFQMNLTVQGETFATVQYSWLSFSFEKNPELF